MGEVDLKVAVLGSGAMGTFFSSMLSKEAEVYLIGRSRTISKIRELGRLEIRGKRRGRFKVNLISTEEIRKKDLSVDLVIVLVKSYDTREAVEEIKPISEEAIFLSLQNGIGNEETISEVIGGDEDRVIGGYTNHGCTLLYPGVVLHAGEGETVIGDLRGRISKTVEEIADLFNSCGISTRVSKEILKEMWEKVVINSAINPITAILRIKNGEILKRRNLRELGEGIISEGEALLRKLGYHSERLKDRWIQVIEATSENKSSMLQDIERGKRTEIDYMNGAIYEKGIEMGLELPLNWTMWKLVKSLEEKLW